MKGASLLLATAAAASARSLEPDIPAPSAPLPTLFKRGQFSEPCAEVSASWAAQKAQATGAASSTKSAIFVPADVAYNCLQSVPVDKDGDLQQIKELKAFLEFQSTFSWLKTHGVEELHDSLDILGELDDMADKLENGEYTNDYDFQLGLKQLLYSAGDFHLRWKSDVLEPLIFYRMAGTLTSISEDGLSLPEIYLSADVVLGAKLNYTPSAIKTINGKDVNEYLYEISRQGPYHDPDARYNLGLTNKPRLSMGTNDGGAPFSQGGAYDGPNTDLELKNGTKRSVKNVAAIQSYIDFTDVSLI